MSSQAVQWTADSSATAVQHVRVDHRRAHVGVAEQFLDGCRSG
jgi:hypothetical protein